MTARLIAVLFALTMGTGAAFAQSLPSGWSTLDIGSVGAAGNVTGSPETLTADGAGADIWNRADAFRFIYTTLTGDGSVVTQVTSEEHVADWTKAGVMMRETLATGSRHAAMFVSPGKGLAFQRRPGANGDSTHTAGGNGKAPYFVKLKRAGNTFTAYKSLDGTNWTTVGSQSITMGSTIYVGLALSSHVAGKLATASFASTEVTPATAVTTSEPPIVSAPEPLPVVSAPAPPVASPAPPVAAPPPPPASATTLRLLHWNAHHGGIGSDGKYDPARIAALVARVNPDIADFNEVDNAAQVTAILKALNAATSGGWKSYAAWKTVIMTRLPVDASSPCTFDAGQGWSAAHASVTFNGRAINLWTTHLDVDSGGNRLKEAGVMQACAKAWPEAHIISGDFNMQAGSAEYNAMATSYADAWPTAKALKATTNYAGNCDGCTRNSRIDYVFLSKGQSVVTVKAAEIIDSRDAKGVTPSDHKPMLVTLAIK